MPRTAFENLRVYGLAEKLADDIWNIVLKWKPFERNVIGLQLTRAADSIGANIAEGSGRGAYQDNRRFVRIARGSLNETQHFLRRAYCRKLLKENEITKLREQLDELAPRLNSYLKSIGPAKPLNSRSQQLTTDN